MKIETWDRDKNSEGKGGISMRQLIKASLRCPDRLSCWEVSESALDMLVALNSGHDSSCHGTCNSPSDLL